MKKNVQRHGFIPAAIGVAVGLSLMLTACGNNAGSGHGTTTGPNQQQSSTQQQPTTQSSAPEPAQAVYDFTPNAPTMAEKEMTIELPKSLMEQLPDYVPYITKVVAKERPWKKLGDCAVDVEFTYNPEIPQETIAKAWRLRQKNEITGNLMSVSNWKPLAELNDSSKLGEYVSPDFKQLTALRGCVVSPGDDEYFVFNLPVLDKSQNQEFTMADVRLMSTKGGTLFIKPGGLSGWQMDYQGNWVRK